MSAPNKAERKKCWTARDAFWKCLDESADDRAKCKIQRNAFEANCSAQWASFAFFVLRVRNMARYVSTIMAALFY